MKKFNAVVIICLFAGNGFITCISNGSLRSKVVDYDSLKKNIDSISNNYQKDSYHPLRTIQHIKPALDTLSTALTGFINEPLIKPRIRGKSISFYVQPSGYFKLCSFYDFPVPDSNLVKDNKALSAYYHSDSNLNRLTDSVANNYRTDSIPNYKPFLWVAGKITDSPGGFHFSFKDTSYYTTGSTGGRSKSSIMKIVMKELPRLRYAYNRKIRTIPDLKGKIMVKFAINEYGYVIFSGVIASGTTIGNPDLENEFAEIIKNWKFEKISKLGDITEVIYPFILSQ